MELTERARKVLALAQEEAQRFNHNYIGTVHILLGLLREGEGVAAKVRAETSRVLSQPPTGQAKGDRASIRCETCEHCETGYLSQYDGQGIYYFGICQFDLVKPLVVDPGAWRECKNWEEKGDNPRCF